VRRKELMRATFATSAPNVKISEEFRDAIYARSEGNPFFTEELLRSLVESGDVYRTTEGWGRKEIAELRIPGSVKEAVRQRGEGLSVDARATLATAAVAGLQFTFEVLRDACGIDDAALEDHLRQLIEAQLVVEVEGGAERYAFRHALTREVVYDDLLMRERKRRHRAVAEALAGDRTTEPALLAHHLLAAGETERAVPHLLEAGDRAARSGAPREAVTHYARAVEVGLSDDRLAQVVEAQAVAYHLFDVPLSIKAAEEALAIYRERGDRRGQSRMLRLAGRSIWLQGHEADGARQVEEAITVLDGEECAELARATAQLSGLLMSRGEASAAIRLANEAIGLAERTGDDSARCHALVTKGSAMLPRDEGLPFIRQCLELALRTGNVEAATRAYNNGAISLFVAGSSDERWAFVNEGIAYSRRHGLEHHAIAHLYNLKADASLQRGDWDAALEAVALSEEGSLVRFGSATVRATIAAWRDGPAGALPILEAENARGLPDSPNARLIWHAKLAAAFGHAGDGARAALELARVREIVAPFPQGDLLDPSPRSMMGGPASHSLISAALAAHDEALLDEVDAEIRDHGLTALNRAVVRAARAALANDPSAAARELAGTADAAERLGLAANGLTLATEIARSAVARGESLGTDWPPLLQRARTFAERAHAPYWLSELDRLDATLLERRPAG